MSNHEELKSTCVKRKTILHVLIAIMGLLLICSFGLFLDNSNLNKENIQLKTKLKISESMHLINASNQKKHEDKVSAIRNSTIEYKIQSLDDEVELLKSELSTRKGLRKELESKILKTMKEVDKLIKRQNNKLNEQN